MLAVAIFALGVLSLGRCVSHCLVAEQFKMEDARARRVLQNRMVEIEGGVVSSQEPIIEKIAGMRLEQRARPLEKRNELDEELVGLQAVTLRVTWDSGKTPHSRELIFYVQPRDP
jgi:hypothetical protein